MTTDELDPSSEVDTVAGIVAALREHPVLVHEALGNGRTNEVHAGLDELVADLEAAGTPTYVALVQAPNVPLAGDDPGDDLLRLIHQGLGEPGLYVVATPDSRTSFATYDVPLDATDLSLGRYDALEVAGSDLAEGEFVPAAGETAILLSVAADDDRALTPGQVDDLVEGGPWLAVYGDEPTSYELEEAQGEPLTGFVVAVACGLTGMVVGWRLLRARTALAAERRVGGGRPAPIEARPWIRAKAKTTRADPVADRARTAVQALRREVDGSIELATDEVHGSLEAAEGLLATGSRLDAVGALVLAEQGTARLHGAELPVRCYFDPLHGPSTRMVEVSGVSLPACRPCAIAVTTGGRPESLSGEGGARPYWQDDSIWAETGFGSLDPDLWRLVAERAR